jgi:hypothetical protein
VEASLFPEVGRTDRHGETNAAFCNFAAAPKNEES